MSGAEGEKSKDKRIEMKGMKKKDECDNVSSTWEISKRKRTLDWRKTRT